MSTADKSNSSNNKHGNNNVTRAEERENKKTDDNVDLVRELFEHFDANGNQFLSFPEVSRLQLETSGVIMTSDQYELACKTLECHPNLGLSLEALRWTYAAEGSNVEEDYEKVFGKKPAKKSTDKNDEVVYEVGEGGVDISK